MIGKLGLIMVVVKKLDRSVAFYRDVLGLKFVMQQPKWAQFDCGNIQIGLHPEGEEVKVSPTTGMSIGVYVDDIMRAASELKRRGGRLQIEPRTEPFGRWALLQDPDGYNVQVVELRNGYREQHLLEERIEARM